MYSFTKVGKAQPYVPDVGVPSVRPVISRPDPVINGARRLFYFGCFLVPLTAVRFSDGLAVSDWIFFLSGALTLMSLDRRKIRPSGWLVAASIFAFGASLSLAFVSSTPGAELAVGGRIVFVWGVWPVIAALVLLDRHQVGRAVAFFVAGGSLSAIVAITQIAGIDLRGFFLSAPPDILGLPTRVVGLNTNPNAQAGTLAVAFTVAFGALIYGQKRSLAACALVLTASGILLSGSISGTLVAAAGLAALALRGRKVRTLALLAVFAAPAWVLTSKLQEAQMGVLTPFQRISSATGRSGISTLDLRLQTIDFAWQRIVANPWQGAGLVSTEGGTYDGVTLPHNMEVLAWFQGGPLMLLAVLIATLTALAFVWRRMGDPLWEMLFAAVICGLAFAQTGPALFDRYLWLPVVMAFALKHQRSKTAPDGRKRGDGEDLLFKPAAGARLAPTSELLT